MNEHFHQKLTLVSDALREHPNQNHAILLDTISIEDAKKQISSHVSQPKELYYIYIINTEGKLKGTVSAHELLATKEMQLKALIRPTEKILYENDTIKDAKEKINKYRLYDLPVISNDGKFLGSLSSFDLTGRKPNFQNTIENEVIFKILGIDIQAIKESTLFLQLLKRSACLTANVLGGIICAMILFLAGGSLKEILALTLFMPVLLTITEAISGQTVAMSIDSMSKKEPDETDMPNHRNNLTWSTWKKLYRTVTLESLMGAAIGLAVGVSALILAAFVEYLFKFKSGIDIYFSIIFLGTVVAGGLFAAFIGFLTPKLLDRYIPTWVAPLANPLSLAASDIATIITYIVFIICFT